MTAMVISSRSSTNPAATPPGPAASTVPGAAGAPGAGRSDERRVSVARRLAAAAVDLLVLAPGVAVVASYPRVLPTIAEPGTPAWLVGALIMYLLLPAMLVFALAWLLATAGITPGGAALGLRQRRFDVPEMPGWRGLLHASLILVATAATAGLLPLALVLLARRDIFGRTEFQQWTRTVTLDRQVAEHPPTPSVSTPSVSTPSVPTPSVPTPSVPTPNAAPAQSDAATGSGNGQSAATSNFALCLDTGQILPVSGVLVLGRRPKATQAGEREVTLRDPDRSVSKLHARLSATSDGVMVEDLGSTNGTRIGAAPGRPRSVVPGQPMLARVGDQVWLGERLGRIAVLPPDGS